MSLTLFPTGLAEGEAFCNRVEERKVLAGNISNGNHTVLSAPRRYGKSSLVKKVVSDLALPYAWVDFFTVASKEEVEAQINKLVTQAIYNLSPDVKKIQTQLKKVFKGTRPELSLGVNLGPVFSSSLSVRPQFEGTVFEMEEALLKLDELALQLGKRVVFVFDEFQQISTLNDYLMIEGKIRHAVERSRSVTYIFSGSNRRLLLSMFSSSERPLYRLCQTLSLERIAEADYQRFLQALALPKWGVPLPEETFKAIMRFTERHPFYVNILCNALWRDFESVPSAEEVLKAWDYFVVSNKASIISDVLDLSTNQKRIINGVAEAPVSETQGKDFLLKTKLSPSSIGQAIKVLESRDILFQDEAGAYRLLDPAIRYYLLRS